MRGHQRKRILIVLRDWIVGRGSRRSFCECSSSPGNPTEIQGGSVHGAPSRQVLPFDARAKLTHVPDSALLESLRHVHVGCRPSSDDIANCGQCMFATSIRKIVGLCADCLHTTTCLHVMFRLSAGSLPSLCGLSSDYLHVLRRLLSYQPGSVLLLVVTGYCRSFS